ncbi:MAG: molybdenum cofactor guanylyltransferase [Anaerolineae bacterium]|jgi:molybdopterin-guanine dinucleotide biosynthesis protein A|nr:molybdenum cofactor guanylyltransferase [Anaerolineae bacterium]
MTASVAILVGGKSSRMGRDKAWVDLGGIPLIHHLLFAIHKAEFDDIFLVTNQRSKYDSLDLPIHPDSFINCGALGGIESALTHSKHDWTLAVACDIPFIRPDVLNLLVKSSHDNIDVVLPVAGEMTQPLCALYHKRCLDVARAQLNAGQYKVRDFLQKLRLMLITINDPWCFFNVNTPQALAEAEAYWQGRT